MHYGIRITGTLSDIASLRALVALPLDDVSAPWTELKCPGRSGAIVVSDRLDLPQAHRLLASGLDVVRVLGTERGCRVESIAADGEDETWPSRVERLAATLAEAVAPVRQHGDPVVAFGCFTVPVQSPFAAQLLGRLLALGRDDATVCELDADGVVGLLADDTGPDEHPSQGLGQ